MLITKANPIIILWQNVSSKERWISLCVWYSCWPGAILKGIRLPRRKAVSLWVFVLKPVCWWLLLSVSFDINRPPFSVYSYPWKMRSLSEINSVEYSSSHSCDSKSWIYLILFLEKFNLFASCYFFCCFCGGGSNRPLINLMNMWLWNLYENEWNMKSNPTKRIQPAALSQNKTYLINKNFCRFFSFCMQKIWINVYQSAKWDSGQTNPLPTSKFQFINFGKRQQEYQAFDICRHKSAVVSFEFPFGLLPNKHPCNNVEMTMKWLTFSLRIFQTAISLFERKPSENVLHAFNISLSRNSSQENIVSTKLLLLLLLFEKSITFPNS